MKPLFKLSNVLFLNFFPVSRFHTFQQLREKLVFVPRYGTPDLYQPVKKDHNVEVSFCPKWTLSKFLSQAAYGRWDKRLPGPPMLHLGPRADREDVFKHGFQRSSFTVPHFMNKGGRSGQGVTAKHFLSDYNPPFQEFDYGVSTIPPGSQKQAEEAELLKWYAESGYLHYLLFPAKILPKDPYIPFEHIVDFAAESDEAKLKLIKQEPETFVPGAVPAQQVAAYRYNHPLVASLRDTLGYDAYCLNPGFIFNNVQTVCFINVEEYYKIQKDLGNYLGGTKHNRPLQFDEADYLERLIRATFDQKTTDPRVLLTIKDIEVDAYGHITQDVMHRVLGEVGQAYQNLLPPV